MIKTIAILPAISRGYEPSQVREFNGVFVRHADGIKADLR